jgi:hypothetical protein
VLWGRIAGWLTEAELQAQQVHLQPLQTCNQRHITRFIVSIDWMPTKIGYLLPTEGLQAQFVPDVCLWILHPCSPQQLHPVTLQLLGHWLINNQNNHWLMFGTCGMFIGSA